MANRGLLTDRCHARIFADTLYSFHSVLSLFFFRRLENNTYMQCRLRVAPFKRDHDSWFFRSWEGQRLPLRRPTRRVQPPRPTSVDWLPPQFASNGCPQCCRLMNIDWTRFTQDASDLNILIFDIRSVAFNSRKFIRKYRFENMSQITKAKNYESFLLHEILLFIIH